jgi:hypothetical protein
MNAFRYETASLIAANPRLATVSTQFTTGSAPFPPIRVGVPCLPRSPHHHLARSSKLKLHPPTGEPLLTDFLPDEIVAARGAALVYAGRPATVDLAVSV